MYVRTFKNFPNFLSDLKQLKIHVFFSFQKYFIILLHHDKHRKLRTFIEKEMIMQNDFALVHVFLTLGFSKKECSFKNRQLASIFQQSPSFLGK